MVDTADIWSGRNGVQWWARGHLEEARLCVFLKFKASFDIV